MRAKKRHAACFVFAMRNSLITALSAARDDLPALAAMTAIVIAFLVF